MTDNQIVQWQCDKCCGDVVGPEGYLAVDIPAVNRAWLAQQEWKGQHPGGDSEPVLPVDQIRDPAEKAPWRAYHIGCGPDLDGMSYRIDVADIATVSRVLAWTLHFMDAKKWILNTDWTSFTRAQTGVDLRQGRQGSAT